MNETDLVDLEIADALQTNPSASFKEVGLTVGLSEATVSRRWARMARRGYAWTGMAYHPLRSKGIFVELAVWGNSRDECADRLSLRKNVITVGMMTGEYNLYCIIIGERIEDLISEFYNSFTELQLASKYRVSVFEKISGGVEWRQGLLPGTETSSPQTLDGRYLSEVLSPVDIQVFESLSCDGRQSYSEIGAELGITTAQVKRSVTKLLNHGHGKFRCDVARPFFDYPMGLVVFGRCPIDKVESVAGFFGGWRETRFCASVLSEADLILILSVRSLSNGNELLKRISQAPVPIEVLEYRLIPQMKKTYGKILYPDGRARESVPINPWLTHHDLDSDEKQHD